MMSLPTATWHWATRLRSALHRAVAALLGVAGGELLISTLVLLCKVDLKLAGSLSLAVSLPTMVAGFLRCSRDRSLAVIGRNGRVPGH